MANSVGSVSIDLEARIAKFESDLGRAARVAEQQAAAMRRSLGSIAAVLGAGISVAGVTSWIKSAVDAQDQISKLSQKVAVSTENLSGWQLAAKQAGVDTEGFSKGLVKLSQSALMAVQNSKMQVDAFRSIGVSVTDSNGHLKDMDKLFPQVIDKLSKFRDSTAKTAIATQIFGRAGADLIPLINAGAEGLAEYTKMAEDFGLVVGSKSAKAAEAFNDSMEQMGFVSKGVANQLATSLAPAMADLAQKAVSFFRSGDWKRVLNDIATGAKYVADHVGDIINAMKLLGEVIATVYATKAILWGTRWIGNLTAQSAAIAANGVAVTAWGEATAASFKNAYKNIGALGIAFNVLGSAVVGWQIGRYLSAQFLEVRLAGIAFVDGILTLWERIEFGANVMWESIVYRAKQAFENIRKAAADFATDMASRADKIPDWLGGGKMAEGYRKLAETIKPVTSATADYDAKMATLTASHEAALKAIHTTTGEMADYEIAQEAAKKVTSAHIPIIKAQGQELTVVNEAAKAAALALDKYKKAQDALNAKAADAVAGYLGKNVSPDVQAWADYAAVIQKVAEIEGQRIQTAIDAQKAGVAGVNVAQVEADAQKKVADAIENLNGKLRENLELAEKKMNFGKTMADDAIRDANISAMSARDQAIQRAGIAATNEALSQNRKLTDDAVQAQIELAQQGAATAYDLSQYAAQQQRIAQEYAGFWENAAGSISKAFGDLITGQTKSWKDFGRSLKSVAQQFISDIISQFLRLRILGPLLSGAMGSVAGWLGIAGSLGGSSLTQSAAYFGNSSTIGETAGSVGGSASGSGSYASMLSGVSSAKNLYTGMFGPSSAAAKGSLYTNPATGLTVNMPGVTPQPFGGYIGNSGMTYAGAAGGLAGAYWGLGRGSGGISTAASTATGAIGGYYAGTAVATAMTAGVSAGLAAIPVVGWIALAAMAVDQVSGGKLFGTKYQTAASDATLSIGANGGSAAASLYQTKQGALFSGRKTRVVDQAVSPEMLAAANALYDGVEKTMVQGAQKLGVDVPAMISASLQTHTTYNDKGQVRATEYIVNYLGQTWKEATAEAASQRIGAEALVATVAASAGAVAQTIAEQWRSSAETLLDGAQMMLSAQSDIKRGNSLVALGATASLSQVVKFVEMMQADGEKLADTYARLAQASAAYLQFVEQFAPVNNTFGGSLQAIAKQMQANIDQANALAQAAGLQGAREGDLANIHQFAAQQAADAIAALSSAAQDIAAKLYGVTNGSLSAVQAQLASMQSKVQQAAQLAIGDNSPLSTKEKLDVALQGLRSGITSADDVLSLGRKLYSSSADFTGLYNKVQDILGLGKSGTGDGSLSDQMGHYNSLFAQQQQMQAQADAMSRFNDAKTLAQYVADISTTHGIDYGEAASGLGFNLADLAKDLGVTNLTGYLDNLKLADIPGVTMNASASVVDAIQQLGRDLIQTLTGGPITSASITSGVPATPNDPQVIALLASINDRLGAIEGNTGDTADTNKAMAKQGATDDLRNITTSNRNLSAL